MTTSAQPVSHGQGFQETLTKLDIAEPGLRCVQPGLGEHLACHVDADDPAIRSDEACGDEGIRAGARSAIDDVLAALDRAQRERVTSSRHRGDRARRQRLDQFLRVAEHRRQTVSGVEMEAALRL